MHNFAHMELHPKYDFYVRPFVMHFCGNKALGSYQHPAVSIIYANHVIINEVSFV